MKLEQASATDPFTTNATKCQLHEVKEFFPQKTDSLNQRPRGQK